MYANARLLDKFKSLVLVYFISEMFSNTYTTLFAHKFISRYPLDLSTLSEEFKDWEYHPTDVVQPPTEPAYKNACALKKSNKLEKCREFVEAVAINMSTNECPEKTPFTESNSNLKLRQSDTDEYEPGNDNELDDFSSFLKLL